MLNQAGRDADIKKHQETAASHLEERLIGKDGFIIQSNKLMNVFAEHYNIVFNENEMSIQIDDVFPNLATKRGRLNGVKIWSDEIFNHSDHKEKYGKQLFHLMNNTKIVHQYCLLFLEGSRKVMEWFKNKILSKLPNNNNNSELIMLQFRCSLYNVMLNKDVDIAAGASLKKIFPIHTLKKYSKSPEPINTKLAQYLGIKSLPHERPYNAIYQLFNNAKLIEPQVKLEYHKQYVKRKAKQLKKEKNRSIARIKIAKDEKHKQKFRKKVTSIEKQEKCLQEFKSPDHLSKDLDFIKFVLSKLSNQFTSSLIDKHEYDDDQYNDNDNNDEEDETEDESISEGETIMSSSSSCESQIKSPKTVLIAFFERFSSKEDCLMEIAKLCESYFNNRNNNNVTNVNTCLTNGRYHPYSYQPPSNSINCNNNNYDNNKNNSYQLIRGQNNTNKTCFNKLADSIGVGNDSGNSNNNLNKINYPYPNTILNNAQQPLYHQTYQLEQLQKSQQNKPQIQSQVGYGTSQIQNSNILSYPNNFGVSQYGNIQQSQLNINNITMIGVNNLSNSSNNNININQQPSNSQHTSNYPCTNIWQQPPNHQPQRLEQKQEINPSTPSSLEWVFIPNFGNDFELENQPQIDQSNNLFNDVSQDNNIPPSVLVPQAQSQSQSQVGINNINGNCCNSMIINNLSNSWNNNINNGNNTLYQQSQQQENKDTESIQDDISMCGFPFPKPDLKWQLTTSSYLYSIPNDNTVYPNLENGIEFW